MAPERAPHNTDLEWNAMVPGAPCKAALLRCVDESPTWFCWSFCQMLHPDREEFKELGRDADDQLVAQC